MHISVSFLHVVCYAIIVFDATSLCERSHFRHRRGGRAALVASMFVYECKRRNKQLLVASLSVPFSTLESVGVLSVGLRFSMKFSSAGHTFLRFLEKSPTWCSTFTRPENRGNIKRLFCGFSFSLLSTKFTLIIWVSSNETKRWNLIFFKVKFSRAAVALAQINFNWIFVKVIKLMKLSEWDRKFDFIDSSCRFNHRDPPRT